MGFNYIYDSKIHLILTMLTLYSLSNPLIKLVLLYFNFLQKKDYNIDFSLNSLQVFFSIITCDFIQSELIPLVNKLHLHLISYDYNIFKFYILKYIALLLEFLGRFSPLKAFRGMGKSLSRYTYLLLSDNSHVTKVTYVIFEYISPIKVFNNAKVTHKDFFDGIPKIPARDYIICSNDYKGSLSYTVNNQNTFDRVSF